MGTAGAVAGDEPAGELSALTERLPRRARLRPAGHRPFASRVRPGFRVVAEGVECSLRRAELRTGQQLHRCNGHALLYTLIEEGIADGRHLQARACGAGLDRPFQLWKEFARANVMIESQAVAQTSAVGAAVQIRLMEKRRSSVARAASAHPARSAAISGSELQRKSRGDMSYLELNMTYEWPIIRARDARARQKRDAIDRERRLGRGWERARGPATESGRVKRGHGWLAQAHGVAPNATPQQRAARADGLVQAERSRVARLEDQRVVPRAPGAPEGAQRLVLGGDGRRLLLHHPLQRRELVAKQRRAQKINRTFLFQCSVLQGACVSKGTGAAGRRCVARRRQAPRRLPANRRRRAPAEEPPCAPAHALCGFVLGPFERLPAQSSPPCLGWLAGLVG